MKTAEEILKEKTLLSEGVIKSENLGIIEAMKAYASAACKEQREICATAREEAEHVNKGWRGVTVDILNAPEPELR